jgi:DNA-binding protein YbaB
MRDFDDFDPDRTMAQLEEHQERLESAQRQLECREVKGDADNGMVVVTMRGVGNITALTIHPDALREYDAAGLAEVVLQAINDGLAQSAMAFRQAFSGLLPDDLLDQALASLPGSRAR